MYLEGKIWKDGRFWLIEVPSLDLATQGKSKKDACRMLQDAFLALLNQKQVHTKIILVDRNELLFDVSDETALLALILKRQRAKHGLSLSQMAKKLGTCSKNLYAQYEQGRSEPSLSKLQEFFSAMNVRLKLSLSVAG
jgi:DNA-binding XRE family transcriptional regulator